MLKINLIALTILSSGLIVKIIILEGINLKIENFENITIAYMHRIGKYGYENTLLMEKFKNYLKEHNLFNDNTVILGIALDDPKTTTPSNLRYDVGVIINENDNIQLDTRKIDCGKYAVFEIPHTADAVSDFWQNIGNLLSSLPADFKKPVIERYSAQKISQHLCEFCIPLK